MHVVFSISRVNHRSGCMQVDNTATYCVAVSISERDERERERERGIHVVLIIHVKYM